jgi:hypothetical protein
MQPTNHQQVPTQIWIGLIHAAKHPLCFLPSRVSNYIKSIGVYIYGYSEPIWCCFGGSSSSWHFCSCMFYGSWFFSLHPSLSRTWRGIRSSAVGSLTCKPHIMMKLQMSHSHSTAAKEQQRRLFPLDGLVEPQTVARLSPCNTLPCRNRSPKDRRNYSRYCRWS